MQAHVADCRPAVILVNTGAPTEVSLTLKDRYAQIPITENSLTALIFN